MKYFLRLVFSILLVFIVSGCKLTYSECYYYVDSELQENVDSSFSSGSTVHIFYVNGDTIEISPDRFEQKCYQREY